MARPIGTKRQIDTTLTGVADLILRRRSGGLPATATTRTFLLTQPLATADLPVGDQPQATHPEPSASGGWREMTESHDL